jgi:hypothetical protein
MPVDFKCGACDLRLSVGWYHYHGMHDGYSGRTLLVCRACGGQHAIEHAVRDRGPKSYPLLKLSVLAATSEARIILARRWLRKARGISYNEALEAAQTLPLVLHDRTHSHVVEAVRRELQPLGAELAIEVVGEQPNSNYGPIQVDRLLFTSECQFGELRQPWTVGEEVAQEVEKMRCALCHEAGSLTQEIESASPCPACKRNSLTQVSSWIT